MIRILIVDDSSTARKLLSHILTAEPDIQVVGEAVNGEEAVRMAGELKPDLILMDIHMPVMDGLAATQEIMVQSPMPIVLISSSTTVHEVETAMLALRAGALTLLLKPAGPSAANHVQACQELVNTIRAMADVKVVRRHRPYVKPLTRASGSVAQPVLPISICAVATSTGGPPALRTLFSQLPANFPVPILVVQHIASGFTEGLAKWLDSCVPQTVKVAEMNERLLPNTIYLAREDYHLGVSRDGTTVLSRAERIEGFRPSGTFLFRSVAEVYGKRTLAIILTGMGRDGVEGLREVRQAGGTIYAQDEESSVVWGMPGATVAEQLADQILPLGQMGKVILARTRQAG